MSVLDVVQLGSGLSLRAFTRVGSSRSVQGDNEAKLVLVFSDIVHLGSGVALRALWRMDPICLTMERCCYGQACLSWIHAVGQLAGGSTPAAVFSSEAGPSSATGSTIAAGSWLAAGSTRAAGSRTPHDDAVYDAARKFEVERLCL